MSKLFKRILILLTILFGGIAFLTSIYSSWNLYENMATEYRNRGRAIAKSIAAIGNTVLDSKNPAIAQTFLDQYFETRGVVYIIIRDSAGNIKYHTFLDRIPVELSASQLEAKAIIRHRNIRDLGSVFDIIEPIQEGSGGSVQIGMDEEWLNQLAIKSFFSQQIVVFLAFLLTVGFAYVMVRRISSPLKLLGDYADALSNSTFSAPLAGQTKIREISLSNADEVTELASTFIQLENQLIAYIKNLKETTALKEKIESELTFARHIQMDMVPRDFPLFPHRKELELFAIIEPAKAVGGDFYDFVLSEDTHTLAFSIGDVSGKGMPAALFMAITTTLIKATGSQIADPATVISLVNKKLCNENKSGLFVTIFYGVLNLKTGQLNYTTGGHNPPYILTPSTVTQLKSNPGLPMGIDDTTHYTTEEITLSPGDTLFLYTDGVTECRNVRGDFFKESGLEDRLALSLGHSPSAICKRVLRDLQLFSLGAAQSDDVTMAAMKWE